MIFPPLRVALARKLRNLRVKSRSLAYSLVMRLLFIIILIVAVVLLVIGGVVEAVRFLLWVGIALLLLAVIAWALRAITGRR